MPSINSMIPNESSPPASDQAPVKTIGSDMTKVLDQGGQIFAEGIGVKRVPNETPGQPGDDSNVSSTTAGKTGGHPQKAPSRAPTVGSAPGKRPMGRVKTR
jgi:hypothetical protein